MLACASIPPGCRSSAARWPLALLAGAARSAGRSRVPFVVLAGFFLFFFRDPERRSPTADDVVLSPADGRVLVAGPARAATPRRRASGSRSASSCRRWTCTSTACRCRAASRASSYHARPLSAGLPPRRRRPPTSAARSGSITTARRSSSRQIVGILARRVVCRVAGRRRGARRRPLRRHEVRLADGRVPAADGRRLRVKVGDSVRGGETVIAVLH